MTKRPVATASAAICASSAVLVASGGLLGSGTTVAAFGSYFPGWLYCALAGVLAAVLARAAMALTGAAHLVPAQLTVCVSIGVIVASLVWLWWIA